MHSGGVSISLAAHPSVHQVLSRSIVGIIFRVPRCLFYNLGRLIHDDQEQRQHGKEKAACIRPGAKGPGGCSDKREL